MEEKEDFSQLYLQNPALMEHLNKKVEISYKIIGFTENYHHIHLHSMEGSHMDIIDNDKFAKLSRKPKMFMRNEKQK